MKKSKRLILFVGGGIETLPGVKTAKSMGLDVIVSDANPTCPCSKVADYFIHSDIYNISDTVKKAKNFNTNRKKINGVICMATDVPLTVATIAEKLSLPGISIGSAELVSDKVLMKDCFRKEKIPIPRYKEIFEVEDILKFIDDFGTPLVIKPADSRGARGVIMITDKRDVEWSYVTAKSFSPKKKVLVEKYLPGPQISTESLVINGKVFTIGFSDRNYEFLDKYSPYFIENGGDLPSALSKIELELIKDTVEKTADALNIKNGVIKGDMVLSDKKPYVIEVASRLSGGYFCSHEIFHNTGIDFVKNAIKIALGDHIDEDNLKVRENKPVSQRYFFPKPGIVKNIVIPDWIKIEKNIILLDIRVKIGDQITETVSHPSRAGVVICTGLNSHQATQLAEKVVNEILIEIS